MTIFSRIGDYAHHPDPVTAGCNRIALIVAGNQPIYPLYVLWAVGGDWQASFWTFLSTPFFAAVPAVARRHAVAGRVLLPLAGIGNGLLSAKVFGQASGVELFLLPIALIVVLAFADRWRMLAALLGATLLAALVHGHYGAPVARFTAEEYAAFRRLNLYSVAGLSVFAAWTLGWARRAAGTSASAG